MRLVRPGVRATRLTLARTRLLKLLVIIALVISLVLFMLLRPERSTPNQVIQVAELKQQFEMSGDENRISVYLDEEKLLPPRINLTFFTTARSIGPQQLTAMRSWLGLGASVVLFADNVSQIVTLPSLIAEESGRIESDRLKVFETPLPRSILGAPRLDLLIEAGEDHSNTQWVCMINADIVVPRAFKDLLVGPLKDKDILAFGERLDCRTNPELEKLPLSVNSLEDLEHWSMAPCWPHGSGGKDYFLYRKGFFKRKGVSIPTFWIGKFVWDHWFVNTFWESAVDMTPTLLVGHFSHEYDWNWRAMHKKSKEEIARAKALAQKDIAWNNYLINCEDKPIFACLPRQSTYDAKFQLCGSKVQYMPSDSAKTYDNATSSVRSFLKPKGQEGPSRRIFQTPALTGKSPPFWDTAIKSWSKTHGCPP